MCLLDLQDLLEHSVYLKNIWYNWSPIQHRQILLVALIQSVCSSKKIHKKNKITRMPSVEILMILSLSSFLLYVLV